MSLAQQARLIELAAPNFRKTRIFIMAWWRVFEKKNLILLGRTPPKRPFVVAKELHIPSLFYANL
jgi:hypothetical protein